MNTFFFIPGSLLILAIGLGLTIYAWSKRMSFEKTKARLIPVSADLLEVAVKSVERVSRFRWTEFEPAIRFRYSVDGNEYFGARLFLDGTLSYKDIRDAEVFVDQLKRLDTVLYDPQDPSLSVIYGDVSPAVRANRTGVLTSGVLLAAIALALLFTKFLAAS